MEKREKRYVPVVVRFDTAGKMRPLVIEFDEEHKYEVDAVLDVKRRACERVGGVGDRYTCRIKGQETSSVGLMGVPVPCNADRPSFRMRRSSAVNEIGNRLVESKSFICA